MKNKVYNKFACVAAFADSKTEYCEIRTEATNPERDYVTYWHSEHPMGTAINTGCGRARCLRLWRRQWNAPS